MLLGIVALSLSGCAETVFRTRLEIYCPPLVTYGDAFSQRLADEIETLPSDSFAIDQALIDYSMLRDRIRACQKERTEYGD